MAHYRLAVDSVHAHTFRVTLTLPRPGAEQRFTLPVWAPGSYLVRDFARHLSAFSARQGGRTLAVEAEGHSAWRVRCPGRGALELSYRAYAFDNGVRGTYLDGDRGFVNGPALFLRAEGRDAEAQRLSLQGLPRGWQVVTSLPPRAGGGWEAADYLELIDHPLALGTPWTGQFTVRGVEHRLAVSGAWPGFDGERLLADTQRICETAIRFWHGRGRPPMRRYVFLLNVGDDLYGGLEHRESTALASARRTLPRTGQKDAGEAYTGLLQLICHEYFHAWNVVRMRPRDHAPADLSRAHPTRLLWFFEGFTSYYEDLLLRRAGLVDDAQFLRQLAAPLNRVLAAPGRHVQSVAEASFDAWVKYYKRDENTVNATVSYYDKGALVGLLADLTLRTQGRSLDEVMRALWQRSAGGAIDDADIDAVLGERMATTLGPWVRGTGELPLRETLALAGVAMRAEAVPLAARLGLTLSEGAFSGVQVRQVLRGSAAEAAGLDAGDELLAADGWRLRRLDDAQQWLAAGQPFDLLVVRDQRVLTRRVQPPAAPAVAPVSLVLDDGASAAARALRRAWLDG